MKLVLANEMMITLKPKFVFPGESDVGAGNIFVATDCGMKKMNYFPDEIKLMELNLVLSVI